MPTLGSYIFNEPNKLLKAGSSGPDVGDLQGILRIMFEPKLGVIFASGTYNSDTTKFVTYFQERAGLPADGKFGRDSRAVLTKVWNTAMGAGSLAAAAPVGTIGPSILQRLRTVGGTMVNTTNTTVAAKPTVIVPGKVVEADGAPLVPTDAEPKGLWAMFKAPVKLPWVDVRVPRWALFGGGFALLGGVVSVFSRKR